MRRESRRERRRMEVVLRERGKEVEEEKDGISSLHEASTSTSPVKLLTKINKLGSETEDRSNIAGENDKMDFERKDDEMNGGMNKTQMRDSRDKGKEQEMIWVDSFNDGDVMDENKPVDHKSRKQKQESKLDRNDELSNISPNQDGDGEQIPSEDTRGSRSTTKSKEGMALERRLSRVKAGNRFISRSYIEASQGGIRGGEVECIDLEPDEEEDGSQFATASISSRPRGRPKEIVLKKSLNTSATQRDKHNLTQSSRLTRSSPSESLIPRSPRTLLSTQTRTQTRARNQSRSHPPPLATGPTNPTEPLPSPKPKTYVRMKGYAYISDSSSGSEEEGGVSENDQMGLNGEASSDVGMTGRMTRARSGTLGAINRGKSIGPSNGKGIDPDGKRLKRKFSEVAKEKVQRKRVTNIKTTSHTERSEAEQEATARYGKEGTIDLTSDQGNEDHSSRPASRKSSLLVGEDGVAQRDIRNPGVDNIQDTSDLRSTMTSNLVSKSKPLVHEDVNTRKIHHSRGLK